MKPQASGRGRYHNRLLLIAAVGIAAAAALTAGTVFFISGLKQPPAVRLAVVSSRASAVSVSKSSTPAAARGNVSAAQVDASQKIAYLTFDDGPSQYTSTLLETLQKNNIKATFFVTFMGKDSALKRSWVSEEVKDGETIGEHSWTHNYSYIYSSEKNFLTDLLTMRGILMQITGKEPTLFRFPGGIGNTVSLTYHKEVPIMPTLVTDVENLGFKPFDWTAGGEDASVPAPASPAQFEQEIMRDIGTQKHPIILMHDRFANSVSAVPLVIEALRAKGYSFGVLSPDMASVTEKPVLSRYRKSSTPAATAGKKPVTAAASGKSTQGKL